MQARLGEEGAGEGLASAPYGGTDITSGCVGASSRAQAPRALQSTAPPPPTSACRVCSRPPVHLCVCVCVYSSVRLCVAIVLTRDAACTQAHTNTVPRFQFPPPSPLLLFLPAAFQSPCVTLHRVHISITRRSSGSAAVAAEGVTSPLTRPQPGGDDPHMQPDIRENNTITLKKKHSVEWT